MRPLFSRSPGGAGRVQRLHQRARQVPPGRFLRPAANQAPALQKHWCVTCGRVSLYNSKRAHHRDLPSQPTGPSGDRRHRPPGRAHPARTGTSPSDRHHHDRSPHRTSPPHRARVPRHRGQGRHQRVTRPARLVRQPGRRSTFHLPSQGADPGRPAGHRPTHHRTSRAPAGHGGRGPQLGRHRSVRGLLPPQPTHRGPLRRPGCGGPDGISLPPEAAARRRAPPSAATAVARRAAWPARTGATRQAPCRHHVGSRSPPRSPGQAG